MTKQRARPLAENQFKQLDFAHVLTTKLYIPPARASAIARPHLSDMLLSGGGRPGWFVLVSGPAGFGKTTLLSAFAARSPQPIGWVSLDVSDYGLPDGSPGWLARWPRSVINGFRLSRHRVMPRTRSG